MNSIYINLPSNHEMQGYVLELQRGIKSQQNRLKGVEKVANFAMAMMPYIGTTAILGSVVGIGLALTGVTVIPMIAFGITTILFVISDIALRKLSCVKQNANYNKALKILNKHYNELGKKRDQTEYTPLILDFIQKNELSYSNTFHKISIGVLTANYLPLLTSLSVSAMVELHDRFIEEKDRDNLESILAYLSKKNSKSEKPKKNARKVEFSEFIRKSITNSLSRKDIERNTTIRRYITSPEKWDEFISDVTEDPTRLTQWDILTANKEGYKLGATPGSKFFVKLPE